MKRYRIDFSYGRYFFDPQEDGDWVRYEEAQAQIERLRADIQELTCGDPRKVCPNCRQSANEKTTTV